MSKDAPRVTSCKSGARKAGAASNRAVLLTHSFLLVALIAVGMLSFTSTLPVETFVSPYCVILLLLAAWSLWSWYIVSGRLFDPYTLFLGSAYIFHGGLALIEVLGLSDDGILHSSFAAGTVPIRFSSESIVHTLFLVTLCLAAFHLGALLVCVSGRRGRQPQPERQRRGPELRDLRTVGWLMIAVGALPTALFFSSAISVRLTEGYGALYQSEDTSVNWLLALATLFLPGAIFLLAGSKGRWLTIVVASSCMFLSTALLFTLGVRSAAVMPLIAFAWVWHTCIRRLPTTVLVSVGLVMLFVVFPLISYLRQEGGISYLSFDSVRSAYLSIDNPAVATLNEMGSTVYTVTSTLELVPEKRPYDLGLGYLHAALNVVPNFVTPLKFELPYGTPDLWLVYNLDTAYAAQGGGLGYSFIAEAYLAFGWVGAPIMIAAIGAGLARFFKWATDSMKPARIAAVATCLCFILHYPRGAAEGYTRQLFWYSLVPYLLVLLVGYLRHSSAQLGVRSDTRRIVTQ